jgi:hypothetical protein
MAFDSPLGPDGLPSCAPEDWDILTRCHNCLRAWADLFLTPKVTRFFSDPGASTLRPRYQVLPRLGSLDPSLEQLRRRYRHSVFQPSPGHAFLGVALGDLELRSLAAVCQQRSGSSELARIFADRGDPYEHTAARLAGLSPDAFAAMKESKPAEHDHWLRIAHALLVAAPMGLSQESVKEIARAEFGLTELGLTEAARLHDRLLAEVFVELGDFLRDDTLEVMADNLRTTTKDILEILTPFDRQPPSRPQLRHWLWGDRELSDTDNARLWGLLERCNFNPAIRPFIERRQDNRDLYFTLFGRGVTTLTGRVRGRSLFSEARRAEYLDLADDAVKAALFSVVAGGFKVVAYAENTIVIELPISSDLADNSSTVRHDSSQQLVPRLH